MRDARSKSTAGIEDEEPVEEYEEEDVVVVVPLDWGKLEEMRAWSLVGIRRSEGTDAGVPIEFLRLRGDEGGGGSSGGGAASASSSSIVQRSRGESACECVCVCDRVWTLEVSRVGL